MRPMLCILSFFLLSPAAGQQCSGAAQDTWNTSPTVEEAAQSANKDQPNVNHKWFKPGVDFRGRLETYTGINFTSGRDDTYYLSRLRLNATIEARRMEKPSAPPWKTRYYARDSRTDPENEYRLTSQKSPGA